jgi:hypothetical protein
MAIIDLQHNHTGVQSWETKFGADVMGGRGALVGHPDGYTYAIFARNYQDGISERRLYLTRTIDKGINWSDPIQITAGSWDDDPCALTLDESDTSSSIALAFVRNGYLMRTTINKETGVPTAIDYIDPVDMTVKDVMSPTLIRTLDGGYAIFYLNKLSMNYYYVSVARNANSFTMNSWVVSKYNNPYLIPSANTPYSISVKRLLNSHLMMVATVRTALNGAALSEGSNAYGWQNIVRGIMQTNIVVLFSSDDGITWTTPDQLTSYANDTSFNLDGFDSVANCDCLQLSDGRIVVAYEEHTAPILFNSETTSSAPTTWGYTFKAKYHEDKDLVFYCGNNLTTGGLFYFSKGNFDGVHRISATSTPYVWTNDIVDLDISPDGNLLVTGSWTGGLTLIDISDANPANWRTLYCLHYLTDPGDQLTTLGAVENGVALARVFQLAFQDDNTVVFSYKGMTTADGVAGGIWRYQLDANRDIITTGDNKHTLTNWKATQSGGVTTCPFVLQGGRIVAPYAGYMLSVSLTTGEIVRSTSITETGTHIFYDSVRDQFISSLSGDLYFYTDNGSSFTQVAHLDPTTTPAYPGGSSSYGYGVFNVSNRGILSFLTGRLSWTPLSNRKCAGYRNILDFLHLGDNFYSGNLDYAEIICPGWLALCSQNQIIFIPINKTGRLRYAYFTYDAVNKALVKTGVDWYDVCNAVKMGDEVNRVHFSSIIRDLEDRLYLYCTRYDYYYGSNEFGVLVGVIEPDVKKIQAKARIRNTYIDLLQSKGRIRNTYSPTFDLRVRVAFAQCFKVKARIVPRVSKNLSMRAAIKGRKTTSTTITFNVLGTNITKRCRLKFTVQTGYNRTIGLQARASIAKVQTTRMTCHFLVAMTPGNILKPTWNVKNTPQAGIQMRAWISK